MSNYVWVVKRNGDMTEGRGPMLLDSVWADDKEAVANFIDLQPGCMGRRQSWSELERQPHGEVVESYGGDWTMERVPLYSNSKEVHAANQARLRKEAMAKLTPEEMDALGLPM